MQRRTRVVGVVIALPLVVMLVAVMLVGRAGRGRELPEVVEVYRRAGLVAEEHSQLLWNVALPFVEDTRFAQDVVVNGPHRDGALNLYALRGDPDGYFPALGCGCVAYTTENTVVCASELLESVGAALRDPDPSRGRDAVGRLARADVHDFAFRPGEGVYRVGDGNQPGGELHPPGDAAALEAALGPGGLTRSVDTLDREFALDLLRWLIGREVAHVVLEHPTEPPGPRPPGATLRAPGEALDLAADRFTADRAEGTSPDDRAFMLRSLIHTLFVEAAGPRAGADLGLRDTREWPRVTVGAEPGRQPSLLVRAAIALEQQALAQQQPSDLEFALDVTARVRVRPGAAPAASLCRRGDPPRLSAAIEATAPPGGAVDLARARMDWAREYLDLAQGDRALGVLDEAAAQLSAAPRAEQDVAGTLADVLHLRGFVQLTRGDWNRTLADSLEAARLDPGEAYSWDNAGFAHFELGQYQDAAMAFERAVTIQPSLADAWAGLGISLLEQGRGMEAVDAYSRAVTIDPGYAHQEWLRHEWYWSEAQRCAGAELQRLVRGQAPTGEDC